MKIQTFFRIKKLILPVLACMLVAACHKQDFLDKKPSSDLVVPSSLNDFQALMDYDRVMGLVPALGEISADNYYIDYYFWSSLGIRVQNAYIWAGDIFQGQGSVEDWNVPYQQVYYCNVVLDGLATIKVTGDDLVQWNMIKGEALFNRAFAFYNVAQVFAPGYNSAKAATDLGIPVRLTSSIDAASVRATVKQTYDQIVGDLQAASGLLPANVAMAYLNRPSRPAAQALLARVYLSMSKYDSARIFADSALLSNHALMDYNKLSQSSLKPVPRPNIETLYQARFVDYQNYPQILFGVVYDQVMVDTTLIRSYASNDLRPAIFYYQAGNDSFNLKGSYTGNNFPFGGLATDELFLIRAECCARTSQLSQAIKDLDTLMSNRVVAGTFKSYTTITSAAAALDTILSQRRKELAFRGLRWTDLQRLNKEGASITLRRNLNGIQYTLAPNSNHYSLPIPPDVINLGGIAQNPR